MGKKWGHVYKIFPLGLRMKGKDYKWMLAHEMFPKIFRKTPREFHDKIYFQEDGCGVHCTLENSRYLNNKFNGRVLARDFRKRWNRGFNWPSKSPDLTFM